MDVDKKGHTALQIAHLFGYSKCAELLLKHGADESSLKGLEFGSNNDKVCQIYNLY